MKRFFLSLNKRRELLVIITAALLIELVSAVQYYSNYKMLETQLEKRAESELVMKAILLKGALNSAEDILENHLWDLRRNCENPDSVEEAVKRLVMQNRYVCGGLMSFAPGYYPSKGRLYEPYARVVGENQVELVQIAGDNHDYTKRDFYNQAIASDKPLWVDPYVDNEGAQNIITSYVTAMRDSRDSLMAVAGIDVSLKWLSDTIDKRHVYPSSFNLLLTEDGKFILGPSDITKESIDELVKLINDSTIEREKSLSGTSTKMRVKANGKKCTLFYANMKGQPHWQIAVGCFDDEVFDELLGMRLKILPILLLAFGVLLFMIRNFANKERQLAKTNQEQERIGGELRVASNIQQSLMAMDEAAFEDTRDLRVCGVLHPAKEVGGDLFHAFVRDDKLFFCIGDVSGKGVPSALIMAVVKTLFRTIASHENNPAHIMAQLNETACLNNPTNIFVTMFVGVLNLPSGRLCYCNAGHEIPVLMRQGADGQPMDCRKLDAKANLPIGLFSDFEYEMQEVHLQDDTTLFLYTDGLTEGRNPEHEMFGEKRMMQVLADSHTVVPRQLVELMVSEHRRFVKTAQQSDDITLLAFCYSPKHEDTLLDEEITLQNDLAQLPAFNTFIKDVAARLQLERPLTYQLRLALEEAIVNVMDYAYPAGKTGDISVRVTSNGQRLKCIITDHGIAFNPTEANMADTSLSAEDRPVGGLGILLVRNLMDSINYERTEGKNVLTMRKDYKA